MNRLLFALFTLVATSVFAAEPLDIRGGVSRGHLWASFTITAHPMPDRYQHAGWDFYHDDQKLFYVGSGWKANDRNKWGLWAKAKNKFDFSRPIKTGRREQVVLRIDFGSNRRGDESVALWVNPAAAETPTEQAATAFITNINIDSINNVKLFGNPNYRISKIRFARSFQELAVTPLVDGDELFLARLQPLFAAKCGACHGETAKEMKGEFDMRSREALIRGGVSGVAAIDLEHPDQSVLLAAIRWQDGLEMPPKENDRLTADEIDAVRDWIQAGAPWPSQVSKSASDQTWQQPDSEGRIRVRTSGGLSEQWTNRRYSPTDLWAYQPLSRPEVPWDALSAQPPRHPIEAFLRRQLNSRDIDPAPVADRRTLIRRLTYDLTGLPPTADEIEAFVRSPSATAFEDAVDRLLESPHYGERMAQHWLDVVRFADTSGFSRDEFRQDAHRYRTYVIQAFQDDKPYDRFIREQIAGDELGIAQQDALSYLWMGPWEHTAMSVAAVTRQLWLDDVTNSVGVTFLGQQLRFAKCHDHKFDPIPTQDYYRIQALFAATKHHVKAGEFKIQSQSPQRVAILQGGALESPGATVEPGALSLLAHTANHHFQPESQSRSALADWISDRQNPLTARVIVNRVWQMHYGRGIVASPNDFGKMGADPTHPELLDWLATWLIDNGWSIKKLHRLIVTSPSYQRSGNHPRFARISKLDPANDLLSFFPPRRLSAEELRDSMLAVTGELNPTVGGPSVYPEINWEVAFQPRLAMGKLVPPYQPDPQPAQRHRRSIYAVRIRNLGHPFMEVFNRPGSELACERRDETTVTPQVFTLMHGDFAQQRSLAVAHRIAQTTSDLEQRVRRVFQLIYGRQPTDTQLANAFDHVRQLSQLHNAVEPVKRSLPTSITLENVKEKTGEPEQVTFRLKKLADYQADLQPWDVDAKTRALADLCLVLFNSSEFLYVY